MLSLGVAKLNDTPSSSPSPLGSGDGDEVGVSFNSYHLVLKLLLEFHVQMATVFSDIRQQPTLVKC